VCAAVHRLLIMTRSEHHATYGMAGAGFSGRGEVLRRFIQKRNAMVRQGHPVWGRVLVVASGDAERHKASPPDLRYDRDRLPAQEHCWEWREVGGNAILPPTSAWGSTHV
jgi:hypothetical protein